MNFYDRKGNIISIEEWTKTFDKNIVEQTKICGINISTVFLGISYTDPPQIFETMIFGGKHDEFQERYTTEEEAIAGHARVVRAIQEGTDPYEHGEPTSLKLLN